MTYESLNTTRQLVLDRLQPRSQRLRLVSFKPLRKGALLGFATLEMPPGLILESLPVLRASNGHVWCALPGRPLLAEDGRQKRDINGKPEYAAIGRWVTRELSDRFSQRVVELLDEQYPGWSDE